MFGVCGQGEAESRIRLENCKSLLHAWRQAATLPLADDPLACALVLPRRYPYRGESKSDGKTMPGFAAVRSRLPRCSAEGTGLTNQEKCLYTAAYEFRTE
jgi:hypothetical protein